MRAFLRDILVTILIGIVIFFSLNATIKSFIVVGESMNPSLLEKDRVIINRVVYALHEPERGDVIVFHPPGNKKADYIKRIIGLPGDTVEIKEETVYIYKNGKARPLDERAYINNPPPYTMQQRKIPENEYFVLGDNRPYSNDSHNGWTVPRQNIIGKAWLTVWPPWEWGLVPNHSLDEQVASSTSK